MQYTSVCGPLLRSKPAKTIFALLKNLVMSGNIQKSSSLSRIVEDITHLKQRLEYFERHVHNVRDEAKKANILSLPFIDPSFYYIWLQSLFMHMHEYLSDSRFPYSECIDCRNRSAHVCIRCHYRASFYENIHAIVFHFNIICF
jgi:hypothetical protein